MSYTCRQSFAKASDRFAIIPDHQQLSEASDSVSWIPRAWLSKRQLRLIKDWFSISEARRQHIRDWWLVVGGGWLGNRRTDVSKCFRSFSDDRRTLSWFLWHRRTERCNGHVAECSTDTVSNSETVTALPCSHLLPLQPGSYVCAVLISIYSSCVQGGPNRPDCFWELITLRRSVVERPVICQILQILPRKKL